MAIVSANIDINIDLNKNKFTNDVAIMRDVHAIRQSIMNIVLTVPGEKPFNVDFGTRLQDSLFDNFNHHDSINTKVEIRKTIERFEPRVKIDEIYLGDVPFYNGTEDNSTPVSDTNQLYVYISYFLVGGTSSVVEDVIQIGIKKVR